MPNETENFTPWRLRTIKQAREERPPTVYTVDKYFSRGSLNIVYGAPGSLKSMLLADMCCAIAGGVDWLPGIGEGGAGIKTRLGGVLWYDYDNGTRRTDERFDALSSAPGRYLADDAPLYYVSMPQYAYSANDLERTLYLIDLVNELQVETLVIDNLGLITGDVEENSAQMAGVMGYLRIVAERTDAAVIVVHHQRKGGAAGGRAGDALRGHSSIEAAIDLAIQVIREPDNLGITIRSTKTRGVDVNQASALFNYDHKAGTHDLETAWFSGVAPVRGVNPVREEIIATVQEFGEISKGRLTDLVKERVGVEGVGINSIRNWIGELTDIEKVLKVEKKGTTHVISLKNG